MIKMSQNWLEKLDSQIENKAYELDMITKLVSVDIKKFTFTIEMWERHGDKDDKNTYVWRILGKHKINGKKQMLVELLDHKDVVVVANPGVMFAVMYV